MKCRCEFQMEKSNSSLINNSGIQRTALRQKYPSCCGPHLNDILKHWEWMKSLKLRGPSIKPREPEYGVEKKKEAIKVKEKNGLNR